MVVPQTESMCSYDMERQPQPFYGGAQDSKWDGDDVGQSQVRPCADGRERERQKDRRMMLSCFASLDTAIWREVTNPENKIAPIPCAFRRQRISLRARFGTPKAGRASRCPLVLPLYW